MNGLSASESDTHLPLPRFPLVQLAHHHPIQSFTCGTRPGATEIDEYLKVNALQEQAAGLSSVWVARERADGKRADGIGEERIAGYFTLSPLSVRISPAVLAAMGLSHVPYRSAGGYLLGRLGVAVHRQGQELGSALVAAAIRIARKAREDAGGAFLAVDPKNDGLLAWYEKLDFGFSRLDPGKRRLVLRL